MHIKDSENYNSRGYNAVPVLRFSSVTLDSKPDKENVAFFHIYIRCPPIFSGDGKLALN